MRVPLSSTPMLSSSGNPRRWRGCAGDAAALGLCVPGSGAASSLAGSASRMAMAPPMPSRPISPNAGRHGMTTSSHAVAAGTAIFPRSPAKL